MAKNILNILKNVGIYIGVFLLAIAVCFGLLVLTAMIPKKCIEKNMQESAKFYRIDNGVEAKNGNAGTAIHYYADSTLLNIIYNIDSKKPVESVLWSKYYEIARDDTNRDFILTVTQGREANAQYLRYWHGSMSILRPLFTIFNVKQIYTINTIILWGLAIALFVLLFIRHKKLAFVYLLSLIMVAFYIVPQCFEYSWTFYIMFIVSIIAILCDKKKKNSWFYMLFFITGIITCYFDFLTTEIITLFVPMLLVLCVRKKEGRLGSLKEAIFFVIASSMLWLIGYAFMWLAKWALAGIILNINPREYVEQNMMERIYSYLGDRRGRGFDFFAVKKNFWTLFPFCFATNIISKTWVLAIMAMLLVIIIDWTDLKGKWNLIFYVLIALAPYARYFVLMSHSYTHYLFTYRTQIITIIAVGMIVMDGFNYKLLNKIKRKVGIKK